MTRGSTHVDGKKSISAEPYGGYEALAVFFFPVILVIVMFLLLYRLSAL